MKAGMTIDYKNFIGRLDVALSRVERGTKKATTAACKEILAESLQEVPRDTQTLAASAYYEVQGKYKGFTGVVGYGGNGDPVNPNTGEKASKYAVAVHEDLEANHPVGKAKFLEDPVRKYAAQYSKRAAVVINETLEGG